MGLHFILEHLDSAGTYARVLFVDFSSAFNTIIPELLSSKLLQLSVSPAICQWIYSFLTGRTQQVRLGEATSSTRSISTGAPQGCVLSPLLFSLYTNNCTSAHPTVKLLKFADDTTVIGLIKDGDESAYRQEAERLELWCGRHNLELNTLKTVEMIVDFRRHPSPQLALTFSSRLVSTVETFKFLGITISQDLKWATNINSVLKKAQQRMYFLRLLRKHGLPPELLRQFYTAVVESVLCSSITVWFGAATKKDKLRLQRTIKTAERIVGTPLPTIEDLHATRTKTRACKILSDPPHPGYQLFQLLPSGGFSMGGAMAIHLVCRYHPDIAGVFALSSFLNKDSVAFKAVEERVRAGHFLPELLQCHGTSDELVLHHWGEDTSMLLQKAGMTTAFHSLPGLYHQLSLPEMELLKAWILHKLPPSSS
ncbi:lysophospholipase-like protein 1 isoform X1 [Phyllopteryx taeniolatus]|uniref:lysophospholipase-like protein 1 isoform X1 n=1 Tax=Phyllopteryx taeniolatus TaxID=161469 RepID=UPI002AD3D468|nr:lysophospholipase-like protein 1 isoform X1 [Phyllopteryx taeniolatus]XP_061632964.1 lysophospholipase-like protein 1 isoform X1 [Phyllopteryx taeniolatus]